MYIRECGGKYETEIPDFIFVFGKYAPGIGSADVFISELLFTVYLWPIETGKWEFSAEYAEWDLNICQSDWE